MAIGADGARGGWLAARCYEHGPAGPRRTVLSLEPSFEALAALRAGTDAVVTVDVPMGLLDAVAPRPCDQAARKLLGHESKLILVRPDGYIGYRGIPRHHAQLAAYLQRIALP